MTKRLPKYRWYIISSMLFTCFILMAAGNTYAHPYSSLPSDTVKTKKQPQQRQRVRFTMPADSTLELGENKKVEKKNKKRPLMANDSIKFDSLKLKKPIFNPNPLRATWLAMIFPGGGQIYNRKYWKLPIVYGGLAGCAYALSWNNKMYKDYAQAYRDYSDKNPNTNSFKTLIPSFANYSTTQLTTILKNRKDLYRRYRDLSIFSLIGVYLLSIVDAYVDAELSNFDISPDLSMKVEPVIMNNNHIISQDKRAYGIQCSLRF